MELESTIKSILKSYSYAEQLWKLYIEQSIPLKAALKEKLDLPNTALKRIEELLFAFVFIVVKNNEEKYVERKVIDRRKNVLDPSNYDIQINRNECSKLIRSYLFMPDVLVAIFNKKNILSKNEKIDFDNKITDMAGQINKIYLKILSDEPGYNKMIQFYIQACSINGEDNPTREMLANISSLSQNIWKHFLAKSRNLYPLSKALEEQMKASKNEKEFWRGANIVIEKKLANVLYREKPPRQVLESKGSKQKRIKGQVIKADSEEQFESTHQCKYCDKIIPIEQELCKTCKVEFPGN